MDFVSFEIAKKLKEKGFKEECFATYDNDGMLGYVYYQPKRIHAVSFDDCLYYGDDVVVAPTISQILEWLREKKEVDLVIEPLFFYDENTRREYGVRVFGLSLNKPVQCGYFDKWEKAALAGIEYVLDNLI